MASSGDVIQVSLQGLWNGTNVFRNVFYYRAEDNPTAGYLSGLDTDFRSVVLTPLASCLTTTYTFERIVYTNLFTGDVLDNVEPTPAAGTRAVSGDQLATFVAAMVVGQRSNNRVRNGRKFIPIPLEADISSNFLISGFQTLVNNFANAYATILDPGLVDEMAPIIVGRIAYTAAGGRVAYRLPTSQAELSDRWAYINAGTLINRVTTMNSRKFWRGE